MKIIGIVAFVLLISSFALLVLSAVSLRFVPRLRPYAGKMLLVFNLLLFGTLIGFGSAVAVIAGGEAWQSWHSTKWKPTLAQVLQSGVEPVQGKDCTLYRLQVGYRYWVDGTAYEGSRIAFHNPAIDCIETVQGRLNANYVVNAVLVAYVHPSHAEHAVLEPGPGGNISAISLIGVLLALGGACALYYVFRRRSIY